MHISAPAATPRVERSKNESKPPCWHCPSDIVAGWNLIRTIERATLSDGESRTERESMGFVAGKPRRREPITTRKLASLAEALHPVFAPYSRGRPLAREASRNGGPR